MKFYGLIYFFSIAAPAFNSEPTELERQREISSMRLKKVFGLSIDETRLGWCLIFN